MANSLTLTPNAVSELHRRVKNLQPIVQIQVLVPVPSRNHHVALISDSTSKIQATLDEKFNSLIESKQIQAGTVVQLLDYVFAPVPDKNKTVMGITGMLILAIQHDLIGEPTLLRLLDPPQQNVPANQLALLKEFTPLSSLRPGSREWLIKARVTAKGILQSYTINLGAMHAFSFNLLDRYGVEISVNCISRLANANNGYYDSIEVGNLYEISNGRIAAAPGGTHPNNEWQILLDETSKVEKCQEDDETIPKEKFSFSEVNVIKEDGEDQWIVDVIGVVKAIEPPQCITCKDGSNVVKRVLVFSDHTGEGKITLWGPELCYEIGELLNISHDDSDEYFLFAVKGARLINAFTASMEITSASQLILHPVFPEANELKRLLKKDEWVTIRDDERLLEKLSTLAPTSIAAVNWDDVLKDRTGAACQKRWQELAKHISDRSGVPSLIEQVQWLSSHYHTHVATNR